MSTLILPADTAWNEARRAEQMLPDLLPGPVSSDAIDAAASLLSNGKKTALLLRGAALHGAGLESAGRVQAKTGARLLCDTFAPHAELGAGRVPVERIPYFAEQIVDFLKDFEQIIFVGAKPPVSFFAYPGKPSWCAPKGLAPQLSGTRTPGRSAGSRRTGRCAARARAFDSAYSAAVA